MSLPTEEQLKTRINHLTGALELAMGILRDCGEQETQAYRYLKDTYDEAIVPEPKPEANLSVESQKV